MSTEDTSGNSNVKLISLSIIAAGLIIGGAIVYQPGAASRPAAEPATASAVATIKPFDYTALAGKLGLDTAAFATCVEKRTYKAEVEADAQAGYLLGIDGTPTTFIGGEHIVGAELYPVYKAAIEKALAAASSGNAPKPIADADDDYVLGNPDAPVTMVVFGDFECPFCNRAHQTAEKQIRDEYVATGKINMVYRDFPLNIHPAAIPAAEAAQCAGAQGKYWQYHDALFDHQAEL